jgi:response regulator of citrate/malate metabolism
MIQKVNRNTMIYVAANYETAMQLFTEKNPFVLLLDMNLQGKKRLELLWESKKMGQQSAIIILSINVSKAATDQCKLLGVTFFR